MRFWTQEHSVRAVMARPGATVRAPITTETMAHCLRSNKSDLSALVEYQSEASTSAATGIDGWAPGLRQASEPATAARRSASPKVSPASRLAAR